MRRQAWFDRLFWDPAFRARVKERFGYFYSRRNDILDGINRDAMYLRRSVEENDRSGRSSGRCSESLGHPPLIL